MGVNLHVSLPNVVHEDVHWTVCGPNYYCVARAAAGKDKDVTVDALFESLFGKDAGLAKTFYRRVKQLIDGSERCHINDPRCLMKNTSRKDYEILRDLAVQLLVKSPEDRFRQELLIWCDYILRFKLLFDRYEAGELTADEIAEFMDWIGTHQETRVFVHDRVGNLLNAWIKAMERGTPWLHYNIPWEDEYVRRHDVLLKKGKS